MDNPVNNPANICPVCHQPVLAEYYFCPNCGRALKEKPVKITILAQIGFYALAIFLPPLGLWPGIKYVIKKSPQARWVGAITIVLTLISTVVTLWWMSSLTSSYLDQINGSLYGL
jgi:hypothetical protein